MFFIFYITMHVKSYNKITIILVYCFMFVIKCDHGTRTVEGESIPIEKAPYTVYIEPAGCTGALLDPQWVITASHCFGTQKHKKSVLLGATDNNTYLDSIDVERIYVQPEIFKMLSLELRNITGRYDVAFLKLSRPAELSDKVKLIKIEEQPWPALESRPCTLAGYGRNRLGVRALRQSSFMAKYGRGACSCLTTITTVCATAVQMNDSPCYGDSGALLVCDNVGVAVMSRNIPVSFCTDMDLAVEQIKEGRCGKEGFIYVFAYIKLNKEWLKTIRKSSNTEDLDNYTYSFADGMRSSYFMLCIFDLTVFLLILREYNL